jgi:hypothetical protein
MRNGATSPRNRGRQYKNGTRTKRTVENGDRGGKGRERGRAIDIRTKGYAQIREREQKRAGDQM